MDQSDREAIRKALLWVAGFLSVVGFILIVALPPHEGAGVMSLVAALFWTREILLFKIEKTSGKKEG